MTAENIHGVTVISFLRLMRLLILLIYLSCCLSSITVSQQMSAVMQKHLLKSGALLKIKAKKDYNRH